MEARSPDARATWRDALVFWGTGVLLLAIVIFAYRAIDVVLLTFAGVLFGTTLRGFGEILAARVHIRPAWGVTVCIIALLSLSAIAMFWLVPHVSDQASVLWQQLVASFEQLREELSGTVIGARLFQASAQVWTWLTEHISFTAGILTGVFGLLGAVIYLLFVAIYYAFSPSTYRRGVIALVPVAKRARANAILDQLGTTLRRWVWARMVSMTVLGVASAIGLALLGIPLALTLGLIAGTLLFIPYLGALAAGAPALLIAATVSPYHVLYVLLLYIAIHAADGYLIDPALQRHAVRLPPILVLASQLLCGALWGIIGFTFATPLIGSLVVLVRMIYVEDVLHASDPP